MIIQIALLFVGPRVGKFFLLEFFINKTTDFILKKFALKNFRTSGPYPKKYLID